MTLSRRTLLAGGAGLTLTAALGGCSTPSPSGRAGTLAIRNVRIFDGERIIDADSVLTDGGLIRQVGHGLTAEQSYDGGGRTLLPGLIDAHVHTTVELARHALIFGVTTQLDMAGSDSAYPELRRRRENLDATDAADVWSGALLTVPRGHGDFDGTPTLRPDTDPDRFVADRLDRGSDYVKIVIEDGSLYRRSVPTLTPDQVAQLVAAAQRRGVLPAVHVSRADAARTAVEAGARMFVHVPSEPIDPPLVHTMRQQGLAVIATLSVIAAASCSGDSIALRDDPRVSPYLLDVQRERLERAGFSCFEGQLDHAIRNVAALREAGIPVLAGTDAANPGTTYGASMFTELDLLVRSGFTPTDALAAATSLPATHFGLTDRGRIAPDRRADLVLVDGDPTSDITAVRNITQIWKNGHPVDRSP
jgi:imidazolonepropionase-like amidohydrolase